ncbi:hypothetical protein BN1211_1260, partial [Cyberlindnera jadinii]
MWRLSNMIHSISLIYTLSLFIRTVWFPQGIIYFTQRIVLSSTLCRPSFILYRVFVELYWFPIVLTYSSEVD